MLAIIIILEIIGGAVGFYFRDTLAGQSEQQYRDGWTRAIEAYRQTDSVDFNADANTAVDVFQANVSKHGLVAWPSALLLRHHLVI